jgi:uncharacterized protein
MLFRRRNSPSRIERLRVAVWPRNSWARSTRYLGKRVLRLTATPHVIAIGFAAGAFASCTPLVGFHFLTAFVVAYVVRGNMIAAAFGTAIGNPLTFPFIWASTFKLGQWIVHGRVSKHQANQVHEKFQAGLGGVTHDSFWEHVTSVWHFLVSFWPNLKLMFIGAVPLGLVVGTISYLAVYKSVEVYQRRRKQTLATKSDRLFPAPGTAMEEDSSA